MVGSTRKVGADRAADSVAVSGADAPAPGMQKLTTGTISGASVTLLVWLLESTFAIEVPPQISAALGTLVTAFFVYQTEEVYYEKKQSGEVKPGALPMALNLEVAPPQLDTAASDFADKVAERLRQLDSEADS